MPDAAARERALDALVKSTREGMDECGCEELGVCESWGCQSVGELLNALAAERERTRQLEEALERLANPTHTPKTEEAALLQIEVEQIARAALDA